MPLRVFAVLCACPARPRVQRLFSIGPVRHRLGCRVPVRPWGQRLFSIGPVRRRLGCRVPARPWVQRLRVVDPRTGGEVEGEGEADRKEESAEPRGGGAKAVDDEAETGA